MATTTSPQKTPLAPRDTNQSPGRRSWLDVIGVKPGSEKSNSLADAARALSASAHQISTDTSNTSRKHPLGQDSSLVIDALTSDDDDDGPQVIDQSCDQIRRKINALINSGEVKVTHLQKALGVSPNSFGRFMKQHGKWGGAQNNTFFAACKFFKKREARGIKLPQRKKAKTEDLSKYDVSDIHLDGEEDRKVPVYESCDSMRNIINAHLRKGVTKAELCRQLGKMIPGDGKPLNSNQLGPFLTKKGPTSGNSSTVFYAAYVYFEKLRIKEGRSKSAFREEMEKIHGRKGLSTELQRGGYSCHGDTERPYEDQYGIVTIGPKSWSRR